MNNEKLIPDVLAVLNSEYLGVDNDSEELNNMETFNKVVIWN
jgi:hypothetical protein